MIRALLAVVLPLAACSQVPRDAAEAVRGGSDAAAAREASATLPVHRADLGVAAGPQDLPPRILLPDAGTRDEEVARAGTIQIRKAHVFERLLETDPARARDLTDMLVLDALVAQQAERFAIRVDPATIDTMVQEEEERLRKQVEKELSTRVSFELYVARQMGMRVEEYRRWLRLSLARKVYREYVARYLGMREDRVQVRYVVSADRKVLEEVSQKVQAGADFATLALRHSEDETRSDGGLLPPFGRGFEHPVAKKAFELEPGQLSPILEYTAGGATRHYLVYCVRRMPARVVEFAAVREELDRDMRARPLSAFEFNAFYLQLRGAAEALPSGR